MSLFSATPDFLKWRDKGFSARPLAVAGALGAGSLDLERLQARRQPRKALLWYTRSSCKPGSRAARAWRVFCWALACTAHFAVLV